MGLGAAGKPKRALGLGGMPTELQHVLTPCTFLGVRRALQRLLLPLLCLLLPRACRGLGRTKQQPRRRPPGFVTGGGSAVPRQAARRRDTEMRQAAQQVEQICHQPPDEAATHRRCCFDHGDNGGNCGALSGAGRVSLRSAVTAGGGNPPSAAAPFTRAAPAPCRAPAEAGEAAGSSPQGCTEQSHLLSPSSTAPGDIQWCEDPSATPTFRCLPANYGPKNYRLRASGTLCAHQRGDSLASMPQHAANGAAHLQGGVLGAPGHFLHPEKKNRSGN